MCDLRKGGNSDDACRAGATGGDIWLDVVGGAVVTGIDGRENSEERGGSRGARSGSEPSIEDIDILLPGRCRGGATGGWSREGKGDSPGR